MNRCGKVLIAVLICCAIPLRVYAQQSQDPGAGAPLPTTPPGSKTQPSSDSEQGVLVRGERRNQEVTRYTVERTEIVQMPGAFNDALRGLQNLPGMARAPLYSGSLMVRGSAPGNTEVLFDGTPLPVVYHFGNLGSTIPTGMLDRIDYYPGNFSARFGRATGGVVDIGLRSPRHQGASAQIDLGLLDASALTDVALTRNVSVTIGARYLWSGLLLSQVWAALGTPSFIGYWDYQGLLEWRPTAHDRVRLALLGSNDINSREEPILPGKSLGTSLGYHIAQLSYVHQFGPDTEARLVLSGGWTGMREVTVLSGMSESRPPDKTIYTTYLDSVPFTLRAELTHAFWKSVRVHLGIDTLAGPRIYQPWPVDMGLPQLVPQPTESTFVLQPAAFLEAEIVPVPQLRIIPGVRVEYSRNSGETFVGPRIATRWTVIPDWVVKAGAGYFAQPPFTERMTLPPEIFQLASLAPKTVNLQFERALEADFGFEHRFSHWVSLSVEGYYKSMDHTLVGFPSYDLGQFGSVGTSGVPNEISREAAG